MTSALSASAAPGDTASLTPAFSPAHSLVKRQYDDYYSSSAYEGGYSSRVGQYGGYSGDAYGSHSGYGHGHHKVGFDFGFGLDLYIFFYFG